MHLRIAATSSSGGLHLRLEIVELRREDPRVLRHLVSSYRYDIHLMLRLKVQKVLSIAVLLILLESLARRCLFRARPRIRRPKAKSLLG